jgi:hypothetical protein
LSDAAELSAMEVSITKATDAGTKSHRRADFIIVLRADI